jgi:hypothetical protein
MKNPLDEAIKRLNRVYRDEMKHSYLRASSARQLVEKLKILRPEFESLTDGKKRRGWQAKDEQWRKDKRTQRDTYYRCKKLHGTKDREGKRISWNAAYAAVAAEITEKTGEEITEEGVRYRCEEAKKALNSGIRITRD